MPVVILKTPIRGSEAGMGSGPEISLRGFELELHHEVAGIPFTPRKAKCIIMPGWARYRLAHSAYHSGKRYLWKIALWFPDMLHAT